MALDPYQFYVLVDRTLAPRCQGDLLEIRTEGELLNVRNPGPSLVPRIRAPIKASHRHTRTCTTLGSYNQAVLEIVGGILERTDNVGESGEKSEMRCSFSRLGAITSEM